jgi:hypothetical protein
MQIKHILSALGLALVTSSVYAQDNNQGKLSAKEKREARRADYKEAMMNEEEGEAVFFKQTSALLTLTSEGYGIALEIGKYRNPRRTFLYYFELSENIHPKEKKQGASFNQWQVNSVKPGKLNNFYQFKIGVGQQQVIGGKDNKNGVIVSGVYGAGLSVGLLKPYMVDVQQGFRTTYDSIVFHNYIPLGAAGFTTGWDQLKIRPGVSAKAGLRFDYGRFNDMVSAIEAGVTADYYFQGISQMLYNKEKQFYFAGYLTLVLGRRK